MQLVLDGINNVVPFSSCVLVVDRLQFFFGSIQCNPVVVQLNGTPQPILKKQRSYKHFFAIFDQIRTSSSGVVRITDCLNTGKHFLVFIGLLN